MEKADLNTFHPCTAAKNTNRCCYFRKHERFTAKQEMCLPSDTLFSASDPFLPSNGRAEPRLPACSASFSLLLMVIKQFGCKPNDNFKKNRRKSLLCNSLAVNQAELMTDTDRLISTLPFYIRWDYSYSDP